MTVRPPGSPNRLAAESSPYLLLHSHNPVNWYPWAPEALQRARDEDRPIFLSVGYSTCYWCHVMERESFSDPAVAALMNRHFVNIKVDREERPDLDEIYMAATQILTSQGGWPNSVFLTPELKPFYAGTYFPPVERHGRPSFASIVRDLAVAWAERRREVDEQAEEMAAAMRRFLEPPGEPAIAPPPAEAASRALTLLAQRFDPEYGGFGGAPKFPTPANLFLLAEFAAVDGDAASMLAATLDAMARGGIYDQLAGGFHRYATDRAWRVPHFEKMLYDNGLLLGLYAAHAAQAGDHEAARIARETARFLAREMTAPEGAFWSAIDAETGGEEGAYYVWTPAEIEQALGVEDATFLAPLLGFAGPPNFEERAYVLRLPEPLPAAAAERHLEPALLREEIATLEAKLLAARDRRARPLTDDKVLLDWNGIAIAGLATAGQLLGSAEMLGQATRAAEFLLTNLRPGGGPLRHTWRAGKATIDAYLADYAHLVRGLLALHRATGGDRWLRAAVELTDEQRRRLAAPNGGFYGAAAAPDRLLRSQDPFDGALPSPNAIAALNLLELAELTGDDAWRQEARRSLAAFAPLVTAHPDALRMMAIAAHRYHARANGPASATTAPNPPANALADLAAEATRVVRAQLLVERSGADWRPFRLEVELAPGWHLGPALGSQLAEVEPADPGTELRDVVLPDQETLTGAFEIRGDLRGEDGRLLLSVEPCDEQRCLGRVKLVLAPTPVAKPQTN